MSVARNILLGTLGIGAVAGGAYLYKLYKIGDTVVVDQAIDFKVTKKNFLGIPTEFELIVNVALKNPQDGSISLTQPFVQLFLDGQDKEFASSTAVNKTFQLPARGTLQFDPIIIPISLSTIIGIAPAIYQSLIAGKAIGIISKATTYIDSTIKISQKDRKEFKI